MAPHDRDVDARSLKLSHKQNKCSRRLFSGQQNGEFTLDYDARELAEYLQNVLVGLRVMARTSTPKEKLHRTVKLSMKILER